MNRLQSLIEGLKTRYGARRVKWLAILLLIGIGSVSVHLLVRQGLDSSALLYVGLPYLGALAIVLIRPAKSDERWRRVYLDRSLTALIVLLASSVVLFEGFVCVLFLFPIYFLVVTVAFAAGWAGRRKDKGNKTLSVILPVIILGSSLEGTTEALSAERVTHVEASRVAYLTPEEIMGNLVLPMELNQDRNWILSIFPMPYQVEAESLEPGSVHRMHTRYDRWFVTNTHEGELHLEIVDFQPNRLRARVVHDTTFFASYLSQMGSEVTLTPIGPNRTKVSLRLDYRRNLDPAWYFHPLQKFAMREMAAFFIEDVLIRQSGDSHNTIT